MLYDYPHHARSELSRDQVSSVVEGRSTAPRVPIQIHLWVHPQNFGKREAAVREIMGRRPCDMQLVPVHMPQVFDGPHIDPAYRWVAYDNPYTDQPVGLDAKIAIADWSQLDAVLRHFPDPSSPHLLAGAPKADGRYRLGHWWYGMFERHWSLRGMTNALTDFFLYPEETHRLYSAITDFYLGAIERVVREQEVDGILTSDDLGTQKSPFFSLAIFREFFMPCYRQLITRAHDLGAHFWLHACGNIEPFIADWIDAGLDVLHPIQKHTMSEAEIAARYGDRITIFAGLDVQQILPWGTPDQVRAEVRYLLDTYWRPGAGRCMLTAGNGINQDCPLENLEAFYDEAVSYGARLVEEEALSAR